MIAKVIEWSVRNKLLVLLLTAGLIVAGIWAAANSSIDAVPDLSDVQVTVITDYAGQAPAVVEDQLTYPLTTALMGIPHAKAVRGQSMFETSMIYVIFDEGTDLYWARSRVLEYLNVAQGRLPAGVSPKLGPDATGVGWVYQYVLLPGYYSPDHPQGLWHDVDPDRWYADPADAPSDRRSGLVNVRAFDHPGRCPLTGKPLVSSNQDLATLRSLQDWYLRYQLAAVPGVAEVASIGGFVKEYQVVLEPERLLAYKLPLKDVISAVQRSNNDVGGSVVETSETEYMVRSRGYLRGLDELGQVPVGVGAGGTPVYLSDVATLQVAGAERRGVGEWDGQGEAVGGVVVARFGSNAYRVIRDAKAKLADLEAGLPPGVTVRTAYDRSDLIERSVHTLRRTLVEEMVVVGLVCILFLLHARSELVAIFVVPTSVLCSLLAMHLLGVSANIMSLGGIAIAVGVVVDSAIVMVENAHKHLDREEERVAAGGVPRPRSRVIVAAATEVGPSLFFGLLIITVSFLPIFVLTGESGRLFKPLAMTKTFAMSSASILSITVIPVLMVFFITPRVLPKRWGWKRNTAITVATMVIPAVAVLWLTRADPPLLPYRWWLVGGWLVVRRDGAGPAENRPRQTAIPISRMLQAIYNPVFAAAIRFRWAGAGPGRRPGGVGDRGRSGGSAASSCPRWTRATCSTCPPPIPSISIAKAKQVLQQTDKLIMTFPEVSSVYGKAGRADTATDPAPLDMIESVVRLKTDESAWRRRPVSRISSTAGRPALRWPLAHTFWPADRRITMDELVYGWTDPDGAEHMGLNAAA